MAKQKSVITPEDLATAGFLMGEVYKLTDHNQRLALLLFEYKALVDVIAQGRVEKSIRLRTQDLAEEFQRLLLCDSMVVTKELNPDSENINQYPSGNDLCD